MNKPPRTCPAFSGTCGVIGCDEPADFETETHLGHYDYRIRLSCLEHASMDEIAAMGMMTS